MATLQHLEDLLRGQARKPPVERWHPPLSGDIDIHIDVRGDWYHDGTRIERRPLINLFASILRRESDGEYYLVTPVEKWRIRVDDAPLLAVDMERADDGVQQRIVFVLNTGEVVALDAGHPLRMEAADDGEPRPYLMLDRDLRARLSRALFYRLVEMAEQRGNHLLVRSAGGEFDLGACA